MSWQDWRRRRDAIASVLAFAEANPGAPIPFDELPGVAAVFADRTELLLALQYDWKQVLWAQVELLSLDTGHLQDAAEIGAAAWSAASALRPVLRRVLDQHVTECDEARARVRQHVA